MGRIIGVLAMSCTLWLAPNMARAQPNVTCNAVMAARGVCPAGETFNVRNFGAAGTNATTVIGKTYPNWPGFVAANPWATRPAYGLQFSYLTTDPAPAGTTTLGFRRHNTTGRAGNWQAIVPAWMDPSRNASTEPNNVIYVGMLVSGAGIAAGTTVAAIGNDDTNAATYGTITLSQPTSQRVATGASISFQMPMSRIETATTDWLAFQRATAAADHYGNGAVYIPGGTYNINLPVHRAGSSGGSNVANINSTAYVGDGVAITKIAVTADTSAGATDSCAFMTTLRTEGVVETSTFRDFTLYTTGFSEGAGAGTFPDKADGICAGPGSNIYRVLINGFRAGANIAGDHIRIMDSNFGGNGYGIYIPPFQSSNGGVTIGNCLLIGNLIAGFAVAATAQYDYSVMSNTHIGYQPFGFYLEPQTATVTHATGFYEVTYNGVTTPVETHAFLTNDKFDDIFYENIGDAAIYGAGLVGSVDNNMFAGGGNMSVGAPYASKITTWITGVAVNAPIYVGSFSGNTMLNTTWSYPYNPRSSGVYSSPNYYMSNGNTSKQSGLAAIIHARAVNNNRFIGDYAIATGATATFLPFIADGGAQPTHNVFESAQSGSGLFKRTVSAITEAGLPLSETLYGQVQLFAPGGNFAGVSAAPAPAGGVVGVIQRGETVLARKANAAENIDPAAGTPVIPTSGGFTKAPAGVAPVGVAVNGGIGGNATLTMDLDPIYQWQR